MSQMSQLTNTSTKKISHCSHTSPCRPTSASRPLLESMWPVLAQSPPCPMSQLSQAFITTPTTLTSLKLWPVVAMKLDAFIATPTTLATPAPPSTLSTVSGPTQTLAASAKNPVAHVACLKCPRSQTPCPHCLSRLVCHRLSIPPGESRKTMSQMSQQAKKLNPCN